MTPPKVLEMPYPWSSVMMSNTLGAPLGGTTCGGHQGFESFALRLMGPPDLGGGGGRYFPSIVIVALGEPSSPVTCMPLLCGAILASSALSSDETLPVATK